MVQVLVEELVQGCWRSVSWRGYRGLPNQIGGELSDLLGSQPGSEQHHPAPSTANNSKYLLYFKDLGLCQTRSMCVL